MTNPRNRTVRASAGSPRPKLQADPDTARRQGGMGAPGPLVIHFTMPGTLDAPISDLLRASYQGAYRILPGTDEQQARGPVALADILAADPGIRALSSPLIEPVLPPGRSCFPIVLLQNPLDRLLTIFAAFKAADAAPSAGCVLDAGLQGFCAWVLSDAVAALGMRNAQCLRLSEAARHHNPGNGRPAMADIGDLTSAKAFLDKLPAVGIADRIEASLEAFSACAAAETGIDWRTPAQDETSTPGALKERLERFAAEVGKVTYHSLSEANALDLALYEYASTLLAARDPKSTEDVDLVYSGERFLPENANFGPETAAEHVLRYRSMLELVAGKKVLDVACGEGFGTAIMAARALSADGVDISSAAIRHASTTYGTLENCRFHHGEAVHLPFPDAHFDVAVSFETIEHIDEGAQRRFIGEIHRVLKEDGVFVISSPNRKNYSERKGLVNPFHIRELDEGELRELLEPFRILDFCRQGIMAFSTIWNSGQREFQLQGELLPNAIDDLFFIAICGKGRTVLPPGRINGLLYDPEMSYAALQDTLIAKEKTIQSASAWAQDLQRTNAQLHLDRGQLAAKMIEMGEWGQQLQKTVDERDSTIHELSAKLEEVSVWAQQEHTQHLDHRSRLTANEATIRSDSARIVELLAWGEGEHACRLGLQASLATSLQERENLLREHLLASGRLEAGLAASIHERETLLKEHLTATQRLQNEVNERDAEVRNLGERQKQLLHLNTEAANRSAILTESLHEQGVEIARLKAELQARIDLGHLQSQEAEVRRQEIGRLVHEREALLRKGQEQDAERKQLEERLGERNLEITRVLTELDTKQVQMTTQAEGLMELILAADKRLLDALEAVARHERHAADLATQLVSAFSKARIPLGATAMAQDDAQASGLIDMKALVRKCELELYRLTSEAGQTKGEYALLTRELQRIQGGHGYRMIACYWRLRDRVVPTGSRRRLLAKALFTLLRHPLRGGWCLLRGDLGWLANGLDQRWHAQRLAERPRAPRTWAARVAPRGSRARMMLEMTGTALRSPMRILAAQPLTKWRTAIRLLAHGDVAEAWMRFQQLHGEILRRHAPAIARSPAAMPAPGGFQPVRPPPVPAPASPGPSASDMTLSHSPSVEVSIIIPVYNNWALTAACLRSISEWTTGITFEIILADDASNDATHFEAGAIADLTVVRSETNLGFLRNCNLAAHRARGRWICLLNNDTQVTPGWLTELVATALGDQRIGAVGARLVFPDGRLQEAGSLVWRDGSATNWGMHCDPESPQFAHLREVDYCSAACLLVDAALFRALGGFDERFAPAFYEDTDLAFRIRAAGRTVVYQPLSTVYHHGGASCGDAPGRGIKDLQERNRTIFAAHWSAVLQAHRLPGTATTSGTGRARIARRLLVIDHQLPTPDRDAGSAFLSEFMLAFRMLGYHVCFVALAAGTPGSPAALALRRAGIEVMEPPHVPDVRALLTSQGNRFEVIAMVRHHVALSVLGDVTCHAPHAKRLFIPADLHWLRSSREAEITGDAAAAARAKREQGEELSVISTAAATVIHSSYERTLLLTHSPKSTVALLPWIVRVPTTVPAITRRRGLAFIGSFAHRPNIDAVIHLASSIWPLVRARLPDAELSIVGADPPPHIESLAGGGIRVLGHVPDLAALLAGVRATVAPLRWGAGFKGKVATSIAHGVPVVVSPVAAEGMDLSAQEVVTATSPEEFAQAIASLLGDDARWTRMSAACLTFARTHWSPDAARAQLTGLLSRLAVWPSEEISDGVRAQAIASGEPAHV